MTVILEFVIGEEEAYKYKLQWKEENNGGSRIMGDRIKEANGMIAMVIYTAERSGSKYVIGRGS